MCQCHRLRRSPGAPRRRARVSERLIAQLAARTLDVGNGRGLGATARQLHDFDFADVAPVNRLLDRGLARIKATVEADL